MSNNNMNYETIAALIAEATGATPMVLGTGGGCEVVAWKSDNYCCWLSGQDAVVPTDAEDMLVLGIYEPDTTESFPWPSEEGCEGLRYYYADEATAPALAALLVEARADIRLTCSCNPERPGDCRSMGCDPGCKVC